MNSQCNSSNRALVLYLYVSKRGSLKLNSVTCIFFSILHYLSMFVRGKKVNSLQASEDVSLNTSWFSTCKKMQYFATQE